MWHTYSNINLQEIHRMEWKNNIYCYKINENKLTLDENTETGKQIGTRTRGETIETTIQSTFGTIGTFKNGTMPPLSKEWHVSNRTIPDLDSLSRQQLYLQISKMIN